MSAKKEVSSATKPIGITRCYFYHSGPSRPPFGTRKSSTSIFVIFCSRANTAFFCIQVFLSSNIGCRGRYLALDTLCRQFAGHCILLIVQCALLLLQIWAFASAHTSMWIALCMEIVGCIYIW